MAELTQAAFLNMVEAYGTRNQAHILSETILPTWDMLGDVLANLRLTGADAGIGALPATSTNILAVTVAEDCYFTGAWITEPQATAEDQLVVVDGFFLRTTGGVVPTQYTPMYVAGGSKVMGGSGSFARMHALDGLPFGTLLRGGDLLSFRIYNRQAVATTTGMSIAYRGFKGPPQ